MLNKKILYKHKTYDGYSIRVTMKTPEELRQVEAVLKALGYIIREPRR